MDFFENKFFLLAITFGFFFLSKLLQKKTGWVLLNPILVAIAMLICFLQFTGVSYETYSEAGSLVEFWLKPAVVALGVPLYLQLRMIKKQLMPILISQLAGCVVGLVSVTIIAKLMGASPEGRACGQPDCAGIVHGNSQPCGWYFTCHGSEWQVWCVRKSGIDLERNSYRFAFAYNFAYLRIVLRFCSCSE